MEDYAGMSATNEGQNSMSALHQGFEKSLEALCTFGSLSTFDGWDNVEDQSEVKQVRSIDEIILAIQDDLIRSAKVVNSSSGEFYIFITFALCTDIHNITDRH